ncbi:MAG: DUF3617 domain-containing protein [Nitrococcus mobilis]|nr:DUF3617 domain-containing protein [Nitrococcus mobilis]
MDESVALATSFCPPGDKCPMKLNTMRLLFALTIAPPLAQAAPNLSDIMTPGLWETTVNMQIDGMPMSLPAQTIRRCVTQKNLDENFGLPNPQTQGNVTCQATRMDRSGNTVDWGLACTGEGTLEADGTATFDSPEAYHATIHMTGTMQGRQIRMIQNLQGRRIGKCQG